MHPKDLFRSEKFYELVLNRPYLYEAKYDGVRCVSWFDGNQLKIASYHPELEMYSRNGRLLSNISELFKDRLVIPKGYAFDGELFLKDIRTTMSIILSKLPMRTPNYYVFDIIPIETVLHGKVYNVPYEERKANLLKYIPKCDNDKVFFINSKKPKFYKKEDVDQLIDSYINQGYEGVVFKLSESPYIPKRSLYWLKGKKIFTLDLKVIGIIPSKEHPGQIQAIVCKLGNKEQPVGSGLTLKQRIEWFKNPSKIIGKIVEVKFAEYTEKGYLRQPTFVRIRTDKTIPDR